MDEGVPTIVIEDSTIDEYVSFETPFPMPQVPLNSQQSISVNWWFSPFQFYVFDLRGRQQLDFLAAELKEFYRDKQPVGNFLKKENYVIALQRKDKTFYRAKIVDTNAKLKKYKVYLVDSGKTITISAEDVFQVEKSFTALPRLVMLCSLQGIIPNKPHNRITSELSPFMGPDRNIVCDFLRYDDKNQQYIVNLLSDGRSVIEEMDRIGAWSIVGNNIDISFLNLQQIRATILSVDSMLEFKIKIEGFDFPLMCSYDDLTYAKANPDKVGEFRDYYENKSFVVNVSNVTADKV